MDSKKILRRAALKVKVERRKKQSQSADPYAAEEAQFHQSMKAGSQKVWPDRYSLGPFGVDSLFFPPDLLEFQRGG